MNNERQGNKPQQKPPAGMPGPGGGRGPGGFVGTEKPKDFKGTLKKLVKYVASYKIGILFVVFTAVISTVFLIVGPKILGDVTTEIFNGFMAQISGKGSIDFDFIGFTLLTLLGLYLLSTAFSLLQGLIMSKISNNITKKLRRELDEKIFKLPFSFYDKVPNGEVLSRVTNDVDTINQGLNQSITQFITSVVTIIGVVIMMFSINWQMTIITLITLPVSGITVALIAKKSQKYFKGQQKYLGEVNGIVEEVYGSHTIVKAFNGEKEAAETFEEKTDTLYSSVWKANFLSGLMMPLMNFIGNVSYVVICIAGAYFVSTGAMAVGSIQSFIQYMRNFTHPIAQLSQMSNVIQQTMAASERVFGFLEQEEETDDSTATLKVNLGDSTEKNSVKIKGDVSFENINFGYLPDQTIINNFSTTIKAGQKVAIVGPTGAGKTTIIKLLMRFYELNSGKILIDGLDIKDFTRDELRKAFGMVLQETWLFNGTIKENIRYGRLDATDDEVYEAAKIAQVDHFIRTLPGGYKMELNEDASNVSQGQKQLLTIARAILADPKILILDEATSSVDTRTESLIQKAMDNLMQNRTSFVIAHRLSTIKNSDVILVLNDGDIVEQGSHESLLAQNGFYANLYNSQFVKSQS